MTLDRGFDRQNYGGPAFLSRFQKRSATNGRDINGGGRGGDLWRAYQRGQTLPDAAR